MTIKGQINVCLHNLNVLYDMISHRHSEEPLVEWELLQVENARICLEKLMDGDNDE